MKWSCKYKYKKNDNYHGVSCKWTTGDAENLNQDDFIISEESFRGKFFGANQTYSNQEGDNQRTEVLKCYRCTTEDANTDPNDPCFTSQSTNEVVECPDLSYTSCYTSDATTEIDGEVFYYMDRGCSQDPVGVITGIDDTGDTPYGRIIGMDGTYTGTLICLFSI